ncbi:AP-4 complex subunit epsilon-1 [Erpetoichthys calabaricus]|uniref:AP-4 complex subunit epsilon-1 n=1 Tax=Erpetoichthys calabaricus TaxID=27687 RepID=UPI0022340AAD|nr:AP-4 complex subunit epsilon-1 [Erpetoichthys calabaricus]
MSDVVEKTLTALPSLLSLDSQPGAGKLSITSKLGSLIKNITELTSKHEESKLIKKELSTIKEQISSPHTTLRQMKEIMVRMIYCEMLGYDTSFGYIHAIKLAQQGSLLEKRVGYLAVSLFLNENHELLLLLVNTVLKDLQSTNLVEVCMALTIASQIFPKDMIPAVLPLVEEKLQHSKEIIRRKAVLALYKFYLIAPNQVQHIHDKFRKALCDRDPGVMISSLQIYQQMIKDCPDGYKDLTGSFVAILKQVVGGKLPVDFNYHSVPAPWLQIQLLRILALLGKDDQSASELMYDVLDESLRRAEINHNITYAILFECVKTVYTIHPKSDLLQKAAKCIGKFVLSHKINLKYLGLKALTYVVQQDPNLALQHQMTIIQCLDHPDPIIKRETLELLYRITNGQNVTVIVEKMLAFLWQSKDEYTTIDLVGKVAELAEKYAPDNEWFVKTMNTVFSLGGDVMQPDIPNNFLRLLAEGFENEIEDKQLRLFAVESYLSLLDKENCNFPQRFLQVISWVLGEYSYLKTDTLSEIVAERLQKLLDQSTISQETKSWIMAAITKLASDSVCSSTVTEIAEKHSVCLDTVQRQHAFEMKALLDDRELMKQILPKDASCEDIEVDISLSFLDEFVANALDRGAAPYKPPHQRQQELSQAKALNFEPYGLSLPISASSYSIAGRQSPTGLSLSSGLSGNSAELTQKKGSNSLKLEGVKKVWGKEGYLPQSETAQEVNHPSASCPDVEATTMEKLVENASVQSDLLPVALNVKDQEKQQLASSLFVGIGSHDTLSLMGKSENNAQRFRKRSKLKEYSKETERLSRDEFSLQSPPQNLLDNANFSESSENLNGLGTLFTSKFSKKADSTTLDYDKMSKQEMLTVPTKGSSLLFTSDDMVVVKPSHSPAEISFLPSSNQYFSLPAELSQQAHSEVEQLAYNDFLSLSACKIYQKDCLLLVVFITSYSSTPITHIELCFPQSKLKVFNSATHHFHSLEAKSTVNCQSCLLMEEPCAQLDLVGNLTYHLESEEISELEFSLTLTLLDFVRPLIISTDDYGKLWLSFANDVKQNLNLLSNAKDPLTATLNVLKDNLCLHIVDIIGKESIIACQLLPSIPCLMHCRVHSGMLAVWLRSPSPDFIDCLLYHCQRILQEK